MNNSIKNIRIINIFKNEFSGTDGNLVSLCKITYEIPQEPTDKFVGSGIFIQQVKGINFDKLKSYVGKDVKATYEDRQDYKTKGFKSVITRINDLSL